MDTLTRVMARYVYGLDLSDLPLDRMAEMTTRKRIIRRGQTTKSFKGPSSAALNPSGGGNGHQATQGGGSSSGNGSFADPRNARPSTQPPAYSPSGSGASVPPSGVYNVLDIQKGLAPQITDTNVQQK
jgi:hypothetical protein